MCIFSKSFSLMIICTISLVIISNTVTFSYADLSDKDLRGADLRGADLSYANLRWADLSYANLENIKLENAEIEGINLFGATYEDYSFRHVFKIDGERDWRSMVVFKDTQVQNQNDSNYSTPLKEDYNDCKIYSSPRYDRTVERDEEFTITWSNPDTKNCRYDVSFYHADKSSAGVRTDKINSDSVSWNTIGTKFFKICPTNVNDCKSPFYSITVEDGSGNIMFIILGIVVAIVILIVFVSKKNTRKKSPIPSSTAIPSSTEEIEIDKMTDIDKQIARNEEKIRKIEEESKRLGEED